MPGKVASPARDYSPKEYLKLHGHEVEKVYHVWTAGESDFQYETFLFTDLARKPRTAVIMGKTLVVKDGWDWFNLTYV